MLNVFQFNLNCFMQIQKSISIEKAVKRNNNWMPNQFNNISKLELLKTYKSIISVAF